MEKSNFSTKDLGTVRNRALSNWQSAVRQTLKNQLKGSVKQNLEDEVLNHPHMQAANNFARQVHAGIMPKLLPAGADEHETRTFIHYLWFNTAMVMAKESKTSDSTTRDSNEYPYLNKAQLAFGKTLEMTTFDDNARIMSDQDKKFYYECLNNYDRVSDQYGNHLHFYKDWKKDGHSNHDYSVIKWELPSNAKIGLIGDWGTGLADAKELLRDMINYADPDCIIHLGDVYYSGTIDECNQAMDQMLTDVYNELGKTRKPFFTIPGNHEYYTFGEGFFNVLPNLNKALGNHYYQDASYFCLRSSDSKWQFLGMDTGQDDYSPYNAENSFVSAPRLQSSEKEWLKARIDEFKGQTILLSHHQLYSAHDYLNGRTSSNTKDLYINFDLLSTFKPYFKNKIAAWFWGHEHNAAFFRPNYLGLQMGRLFGASAFEAIKGSGDGDPYYINNKKVAYTSLDLGGGKNGVPKLKVSTNNAAHDPNQYYQHAYAILTLATDNSKPCVRAEYHQVESWSTKTSTPNKSDTLLAQEKIFPAMGGLNPNDYIPTGSKQGNAGNWGSTWLGDNDLNRNTPKNQLPTISKLSNSELKVYGTYEFYNFHVKHHTGTINVHLKNMHDPANFTVELKVTGDWFDWNIEVNNEPASAAIADNNLEKVIITGLGSHKYTLEMARSLAYAGTAGGSAFYDWHIEFLIKTAGKSDLGFYFKDHTIPSVIIYTGAGMY